MAKPRYRVGSDGSNPRAVIGDNGGLSQPDRKAQWAYMHGNASQAFDGWNPPLADSRDDVRASYVDAAARAIDGMHNSGWLAGAVDQAVNSTIGTGLRLASRPDAAALGWTAEQANDWARIVERRWEAWAAAPVECDAAGKQTLGLMTASVLRSYFSHGEALALVPMVRRPGATTRTKVKLLQPHKLTQYSDGFRTFQGVTMDDWGAPVSYRLRLKSPGFNSVLGERDVDIRARDGAGRQQVIHVFKGDADQVRGITPLAPALRIVRRYDQLNDATLQSALLRAIFAATIKSDLPTSEILQGLQDENEQNGGVQRQGTGPGTLEDLLGAKAGWYENTKIDFGRAGKIAHLFPGEEFNFHTAGSPDAAYEAFARFLLREMARCLGMTFEEFTSDYNGVTYTGARLGTSATWPIVLSRRTHIGGRFLQQVFEAWLEEEIEEGRIEFPGGLYAFIAVKSAAARAEWRGPAKPQADDLKTMKAHEGHKRMGVMTDEMICADLGQDWEDVYDQRAREMAMRKKLGLPEGDTMPTPQDEALVNGLIADDATKKGETA